MKLYPQNILAAARSYVAAGQSVLPIKRDGSKAPATKWEDYQRRLPTDPELVEWFQSGDYGIAVVCGAVSGNKEVIDLDSREKARQLHALAKATDSLDLVKRITRVGTPRPGTQLHFRCQEAVGGNQQLAFELLDIPEGTPIVNGSVHLDGQPKPLPVVIDDNGIQKAKHCAIETRGEGGYTLMPGSPGDCHPTGREYKTLDGDICDLPVITAEERDQLHTLCRMLNEWNPPAHAFKARAVDSRGGHEYIGTPPGMDYNERGQEHALQILTDYGWGNPRPYGGGVLLARPGKTRGHSAAYGVKKAGLMVYSTNGAPFEPHKTYSPFAIYAVLKHGGDFSAAASDLYAQDYGTRLERAKWDDQTSAAVSDAISRAAEEDDVTDLAMKQVEEPDEATSDGVPSDPLLPYLAYKDQQRDLTRRKGVRRGKDHIERIYDQCRADGVQDDLLGEVVEEIVVGKNLRAREEAKQRDTIKQLGTWYDGLPKTHGTRAYIVARVFGLYNFTDQHGENPILDKQISKLQDYARLWRNLGELTTADIPIRLMNAIASIPESAKRKAWIREWEEGKGGQDTDGRNIYQRIQDEKRREAEARRKVKLAAVDEQQGRTHFSEADSKNPCSIECVDSITGEFLGAKMEWEQVHALAAAQGLTPADVLNLILASAQKQERVPVNVYMFDAENEREQVDASATETAHILDLEYGSVDLPDELDDPARHDDEPTEFERAVICTPAPPSLPPACLVTAEDFPLLTTALNSGEIAGVRDPYQKCDAVPEFAETTLRRHIDMLERMRFNSSPMALETITRTRSELQRYEEWIRDRSLAEASP